MASVSDCSSEAGVEAFYGVCGVDDSAQLGGERQERHELVPAVLPGLDHGRVCVGPVGGELGEAGLGGAHGGCGAEISRMALVIWPQCFLDAYRRLLRTMCTTQVWTVASGQVARIDSGRPPITVAAHDQRVGQAAVSQLGQHRGPLLGALAAGGPEPQAPHVAFAGEIHADGDVHGPVGDLRVADLDHDRVEPSTG